MVSWIGTAAVFADSLFPTAADPAAVSIFTDRRARDVGDIITIRISENTNSAQSGTSTLNKKSSLEATIQSLFYSLAQAPTSATDALYSDLSYLGSRTGSHRGTLPSSEWESEADFEGDGELSTSNQLSGTITAMILEVLPNGNFLVEGKRELTVDHQKQTIILSGIVRPEDIGADNTVASHYIANARIVFDGKGPISEYRKRGILQRLWDWLAIY